MELTTRGREYEELVKSMLEATHDAWMADRQRRAVRFDMARQLVGLPNPATNRAHSVTSAMEAAEETSEYRAAVEASHMADLDKMQAEERLRLYRLMWLERIHSLDVFGEAA